MKDFIFNMPTRVLFGAGQLERLHEQKLPGKKALIVTYNGQSVKKYGYLARTEKELEPAAKWILPRLSLMTLQRKRQASSFPLCSRLSPSSIPT